MFLDNQLRFSNAQAVTADAASTNYHDCGPLGIQHYEGTLPTGMTNAGINVGVGCPVYGWVQCSVDLDGGSTDETLTIRFVSSSDTTLAATDVVHWTSAAYTNAAPILAGTLVKFLLPPDTTFLRYIGFHYDVGGTSPTVTLSAGISLGVPAWEASATGTNLVPEPHT